jgi:transcriptional regulator with XRE-family HTH domain
MKNIRKKLGNRIRQLRHKKNISQEELADKCSLHRTYIGGIERGERNPSLDNLGKISKALEVELFELFRDMDA